MSTVTDADLHNCFIIYKVSGFLSMVGSAFILRDIYRRKRGLANGYGGNAGGNRRGSVAVSTRNLGNRSLPLTTMILCELSTSDFFGSLLWLIVGKWLVEFSKAGCTAQGFLLQLFNSWSLLCNTSLAIAYCLNVKKGWANANLPKKKTLPFLIIPPAIALTAALLTLPFNMYNYDENQNSCTLKCEKGEDTAGLVPTDIILIVNTASIIIINLIIVVSIIVLVHSVLTQERKMDRYSFHASHASADPSNRNSSTNRTLTTKTAWQGIWYNVAFAIVWWPYVFSLIVQNVAGIYPKALVYLMSITTPLQGFFNAVLYFRPKYKEHRERNGEDSAWRSLGCVLGMLEEDSVLPSVVKAVSLPSFKRMSTAQTASSSIRSTTKSKRGSDETEKSDKRDSDVTSKRGSDVSNKSSMEVSDRTGHIGVSWESSNKSGMDVSDRMGQESQDVECSSSDKDVEHAECPPSEKDVENDPLSQSERNIDTSRRSSYHGIPALEQIMLGQCDSEVE